MGKVLKKTTIIMLRNLILLRVIVKSTSFYIISIRSN